MRGRGITRRTAMMGASSLAVSGVQVGAFSAPGEARAPLLKTQAPYFYRFAHGTMQVTMVSDGPIWLEDPSAAFFGASKEELSQLLADNFLAPTNILFDQNSPVVNTGSNLILFDTGLGTEKMFGTTQGRLVQSLREAGIQPGQIDSIVISHAHIDHIGGLVDAASRRLFPNATIYINQTDFDFWTDETEAKTKPKPFVTHARKNLLPYRDRIKFIRDGQEFLPGVTAMATPGHTIGHMIFMITSENKTFCFTGDLTHHPVLMVQRPRIEFAYDTDPKQSAETRVRTLTMLAEKRIPIVSFHFPWPGLGHISKQGDGFRYHPSTMEIVTRPPAVPQKPAAGAAPKAK